MLHATCSNCGRSYGANRVHSGHNYCGASCKQKAYRARKLQLKKAKQGTYTMKSRMAVNRLSDRYGITVAYMFEQMFLEHGGQALEMTIAIAEFVDWDDPEPE